MLVDFGQRLDQRPRTELSFKLANGESKELARAKRQKVALKKLKRKIKVERKKETSSFVSPVSDTLLSPA